VDIDNDREDRGGNDSDTEIVLLDNTMKNDENEGENDNIRMV